LLAPDLLIADCADVLRKKVRRRELLEEEEALMATGLLARSDTEFDPMIGVFDAAVRMAILLIVRRRIAAIWRWRRLRAACS
jgi:predicted nucleic acid-binding protein